MDTRDDGQRPLELCMELAFPGEAPLVYGALDELPDLLRAMLGPTPCPVAASGLTVSLTQRPIAPETAVVCDAAPGPGRP